MADDSALLQAGDIVGGKYRIERLLGTGGMSTVFEATHRLTERRFAIKWLRPELATRDDGVRRFVREAKVAGRVKHPNIIEVYDFGEHAGSFYMVLELLEGEPLDERVNRRGRLSPEEAYRILMPCMRAVARAHAAGVVHRDLKPANIFLCRATEERPELPKVLDFGISSIANLGVQLESPITESGMLIGTPHYMSPEQVRVKAVDHRTDVYAFGVILYEVLAGRTPYESERYSELMVKIATETPKPLDQLVPLVDAALAQIVRRAMARDPAERFPDMGAMAQALHAYAIAAGWQHVEPVAALPAPKPSIDPAVRRMRWIGGAAAALALSAALLFWLQHSTAPAPVTAGQRVQPASPAQDPTPGAGAKVDPSSASAAATRARGLDAVAPAHDSTASGGADPARGKSERSRTRRSARAESDKRILAASASGDPSAKPPNRSGAKLSVGDFLPAGEQRSDPRTRAH